MRNIRFLVLGHRWKKHRVQGSVFLRCVRRSAEAEPANCNIGG